MNYEFFSKPYIIIDTTIAACRGNHDANVSLSHFKFNSPLAYPHRKTDIKPREHLIFPPVSVHTTPVKQMQAEPTSISERARNYNKW